jgi:hypothetical protein
VTFPGFDHCDAEHTRRGGWRGAFSGLGVVNGFENTWGPWMILDQDQPGLIHLLHLRRFFTKVIPFHRLRPAPDLIAPGDAAPGHRPLALASDTRDVVAVYLPVGGDVSLYLPEERQYNAHWYDPRTGDLRPATPSGSGAELHFTAPVDPGKSEHPWDWALALLT